MKKIILSILIIAGVAFSCDDRLEDLNKPRKDATVPSGEALFANGVRGMFDMMVSTNVNENVFRLYAQYWAQTTYPDESQYNMVGRSIPDNFWTNAYRDVLKDLDEARKVIEETWEQTGMSEGVRDNQLSMINICKVYTYSVLVDAFGAVPFTEALNDEILVPKYDNGQAVYDQLIVMLDEAIATLDEDEEGFSGTQDVVYGGDIEKWLKFANSLKLKLAVTIADVNPTKAASMVTEAEPNVFSSNADNASITYLATSPNTNPLWEDLVQSGRADYVIANTVVDKLVDLNDPRLIVYAAGRNFNYPTNKATGAKRDSTITSPAKLMLYYPDQDSIVNTTAPFTVLAKDSLLALQLYKGGEYGTANTYSANSHVGDLFHEPSLEGVILDYAEVQFLLAEAAARGIATEETVETYYENGIVASMEYWGVSESLIEDYLDRPDVDYATATGTWKQKIGIQEWLALYNRGFEGWTTWRRLDFTGFNVPEDLTESDIPRRLIFPIEEATLNPSSWRAAIEMIGGSDDVQTKVFWDVN
ncbi:SusD/RagB family nutrient-binding outer membrane lipoprotein [Chryseolinea sp. H1M3-3]|uniref:SusD/RagB family nutrient-binding outer membrane lipoprotein n=1 Tax=Chryseolinea sp. H1M3-3 TaxID=3034144 RepID=UPI0023EE0C94|nr:SusD/RagB family nutrient-binding outer membrane lipoprotein [Chryseolinea sp. H1M3-3]